MELHTLDRVMAMPQAHDQPVFRLGRDLEHVGHGVTVDDERVIARCGERVRESREHARAVVTDLRRLAVHHHRCPHDISAVELADALQPETYAENRNAPLAEMTDGVVRQAGVARTARARRDQHRVGTDLIHLLEGDRIVAMHDRFRAELTQVLHEVVNERVVVVDHEHARHDGQGTRL